MFHMPITAKKWGAALAIALTLASQGKAGSANIRANNKEGAGMIKIQVVVGDIRTRRGGLSR